MKSGPHSTAALWVQVVRLKKMLLLIPVHVIKEVPEIRDFLLRLVPTCSPSPCRNSEHVSPPPSVCPSLRAHPALDVCACLRGAVLIPACSGKSLKKVGKGADETKEDRSKSYLAAAVDAVAEIDEQGNIEMINHHTEAMFQVDPSHCVGRPLASLLSKGCTPLFKHMIHSMAKDPDRENLQEDLEGRRKDGTLFPLRLSLAPGYLTGRLMFVVFMKDISREHLQQTLIQQREELDVEKARSEELLLNILPRSIAAKLKSGQGRVANGHESVSVVFCDMPQFMEKAAGLSPTETVALLDEVFSMMDELSMHYGIEKIKTIGDCFMAVGGLFEGQEKHAEACVDFALDVVRGVEKINERKGSESVSCSMSISLPLISSCRTLQHWNHRIVLSCVCACGKGLR